VGCRFRHRLATIVAINDRDSEPENMMAGLGPMTDSLLVLMIALAASAGLIVLLKPMLARYAMARPNARSSHKIPTPQGGGIAVVAATFAGVLAAAAFGAITPDILRALWSLAAAVLLLAAVGACDDILHMPVGPRLVLQFVAVGLVLAALPHDARIIPQLPWWLERAGLLIGGVYVINLVNFMDGIDWMTVAEVVPVTAGLCGLFWFGALPLRESIIAAALLGAVAGFAPFNRPVAKLFLGDVGSLPIGLLLFWLLLQLATRGHVAAALLLPLYYLADATVTLGRRFATGENVLQAHRSHFYQRAVDLGFSVSEVVCRVFLANLMLAALAVATVSVSSAWARVAALAIGVAVVAWLLVDLARGKR
jgi:UDP-N-acetylmuramyl pentapeptide phosphotransferase/UDP-N-acetylglucosamine-1-phosphate transferase